MARSLPLPVLYRARSCNRRCNRLNLEIQVLTDYNPDSHMSRPPTEFKDDHVPLGYLLTFRGYGTWLHGDSRGSVDRFHRTYGTPMLPPNVQRTRYEGRLRKQPPVTLNPRQRAAHRIWYSRNLHHPQLVAVGLQHPYEPCSYGCIG
jgi:hypothetical protein